MLQSMKETPEGARVCAAVKETPEGARVCAAVNERDT